MTIEPVAENARRRMSVSAGEGALDRRGNRFQKRPPRTDTLPPIDPVVWIGNTVPPRHTHQAERVASMLPRRRLQAPC